MRYLDKIMKTEQKQEFIKEANDSFKILVRYLGMLDSRANLLFLKWPDAMQALVAEDYDMFRKDMAILICQPVHALALALQEYTNQKLNQPLKVSSIELIMEQAPIDPIGTKKALVQVCNTDIFLLKSNGYPMELI